MPDMSKIWNTLTNTGATATSADDVPVGPGFVYVDVPQTVSLSSLASPTVAPIEENPIDIMHRIMGYLDEIQNGIESEDHRFSPDERITIDEGIEQIKALTKLLQLAITDIHHR